MNQNKKCGLYLHIPFCRRKCLYCDFFSAGEKLADWDLFTRAILAEAKERKEELPSLPSTLYIGGGTPSLIPEVHFRKLIEGLRVIFPGLNPQEFSIEANPDDVIPEKIIAWKESGVNRVSIGVQTFSDEELRKIGRSHTGKQAEEALRLLSNHFNNISADLIFGLPDQTRESWQYSVERLLSVRPAHISSYALMYEERTALTVLRNSGRLQEASDEETEWMYDFLLNKMRENGYSRYEISNYSLPDKFSRHNTLYWEGNAYLGLGPSAHSYDGVRTRRCNPADLRGYLSAYSKKDASPYDKPSALRTPAYKDDKSVALRTPAYNDDKSAVSQNSNERMKPFYDEEYLSDEEMREEYILTRMRLASGISLEEYRELWGEESLRNLRKNAGKMINRGYMNENNGHIFFTDAGVMIADNIIVELAI